MFYNTCGIKRYVFLRKQLDVSIMISVRNWRLSMISINPFLSYNLLSISRNSSNGYVATAGGVQETELYTYLTLYRHALKVGQC